MISNVAPPTTEATGAVTPASGDAGESGLFDVLLSLQSLANPDPAAAVPGQAASLEGADLMGTLEDPAEDPADDSEEPVEAADASEGALWFLNAWLPTPKVTTPAQVSASVSASVSAQVVDDPAAAGVAPQGTASPGVERDSDADLAQVLATGTSTATTSDSDDSRTSAPAQAAATPVIDTTTWNSLSGPAELFAQGMKHSVERVESAPLTTHVRDPRWADDLGNRLASMVRTGDSSASLQLTPPDLGPLEVNVAVRDNQATVHFGATSAETRALLEASIPRLREMLASQGFQLMDSSVSHGFARQTRHESAGTPRVDSIGEAPTHSAQPIRITGLLDLYA